MKHFESKDMNKSDTSKYKILIIAILTLAMNYGCSIAFRKNMVEDINEKLNFLNYASNTYGYPELSDYKDKNGEYPESRELVEKYVYSYNTRKKIKEINPTLRVLFDPFSDTTLIYSPIYHNGKVVDYLIYSIGPDGLDENIDNIYRYNSSEVDTLEVNFRLPNDSLNICDRVTFDILIRIPYNFIQTGHFKNKYYKKTSEFYIGSNESKEWID